MKSNKWAGLRVHRTKRQAHEQTFWLAPRAVRYTPLVLFAVALVVYLLTMAPRLTWGHAGRDGGDFITAAWVLGVPHPTGYPTYTMLAWLFTRLPLGGVAWRVGLLSGFAGAGAVALAFLIGRRLAAVRRAHDAAVRRAHDAAVRRAHDAAVRRAHDETDRHAHEETERTSVTVLLGVSIGALLLGFSPLFWGQSLIAEVYTLHLFFVALVIWLMLRWRAGEGPLALAAFAFGVGMGNHITLTFLGPVILLLLWDGRGRLSWRGVILAVPALAAGLSVYLYLPWRASTDPIINWGDPDTWEGFKWMVTGRGYRRFFFALPREELSSRLKDWWNLTGDQFPSLAWPLAALGLWELARRDRWLALGSFVHAAISLVYSIGYDVSDAFVHLLPAYFYLALWMGQGAASLLGAAARLRRPGRDPVAVRRAHDPVLVGLVAAGLLLLPVISLFQEWEEMDLTRDQRAEAFAKESLEVVEPDSLILVGADAYTFALWYQRYVEQLRPDVAIVNTAMMGFDWYRHTVAVHHPEVAQPGERASRVTVLDLVLRNLDERPVYVTKDVKDEGDLDVLKLTQAGELWRVTSP